METSRETTTQRLGAQVDQGIVQMPPRDTSMTSLNDDMVKLVAYTIVSLKPGAERILPHGAGSLLVTENTNEETFTSWMIARYLQSESYKALDASEQLSQAEQKYLCVDFVVSRRWQRRPLKYEEQMLETEEQKLEILGKIR